MDIRSHSATAYLLVTPSVANQKLVWTEAGQDVAMHELVEQLFGLRVARRSEKVTWRRTPARTVI